jgi:hypothetical protein
MVVYKIGVERDGPKATPYSWQIYRADVTGPIEKSAKHFRIAMLAKIAGHCRLTELGLGVPEPKVKR